MMEENRNTFTSLKHLEQFQSNHDQKQKEEDDEEEEMKYDDNSNIEEEEEEEEDDVLEAVEMGDDETIMNEEEEEEEMKRSDFDQNQTTRKSQGIWGEVEKMLIDNNLSDRRSKSLQIDEILNLLALFHDLHIHFTT